MSTVSLELFRTAAIEPPSSQQGITIVGFGFAEDDSRILFCLDDGSIHQRSLDDDTAELLVPAASHPVRAARFLDAGFVARSILEGDRARVVVTDLADPGRPDRNVSTCLSEPGDFSLASEGRLMAGRISETAIGLWDTGNGELLLEDRSDDSTFLFFGLASDGTRLVVGDLMPFDWDTYSEELFDIWIETGQCKTREEAAELLDETFPPPRHAVTRIRVHQLGPDGTPTKKDEVQLYSTITCAPVPIIDGDAVVITTRDVSCRYHGIHGSIDGPSGMGGAPGVLLKGRDDWLITTAGPWNSNLIAGVSTRDLLEIYNVCHLVASLQLEEPVAEVCWSPGGRFLGVLFERRTRIVLFELRGIENYKWNIEDPVPNEPDDSAEFGDLEQFAVLSSELHEAASPEAETLDMEVLARACETVKQLTVEHVSAPFGPFVVLPFLGAALNLFRRFLPEDSTDAIRHIRKLVRDCSRSGVEVSIIGPDMLPTFGFEASSVLAELLIAKGAREEAVAVLETQLEEIKKEAGDTDQEGLEHALDLIRARLEAARNC